MLPSTLTAPLLALVATTIAALGLPLLRVSRGAVSLLLVALVLALVLIPAGWASSASPVPASIR